MLDITEYGLTYFWKVNRGKHGQENCEGTSGMGGWKIVLGASALSDMG